MFKKLSDLENLLKQRSVKPVIALAVSQDLYSLKALYKAYSNKLINVALVGDMALTKDLMQANGLDFKEAKFVDEPDKEAAVEKAVKLVSSGEANCLMKGKIATPIVLKAVLNKEWGLRTGKLLSHLALFQVDTYHKLIGVSDVAMNIAPNLKEKIQILNNSVAFLNKLGMKRPKVAVLGAIEMVNESMQATTDAALLSKMQQRDQIKNCIVDGPLAFDNAVSFESAKQKSIRSEVAGDTDLLLMPDIEVGNVMYKSLIFFAKAKVASVILGASAPIVLTSRSDSEESKYYSVLLASLG